jgi:hypothetical protein
MNVFLKIATLILGFRVGVALATLSSRLFNDSYSTRSWIDHLFFAFSTGFLEATLLLVLGVGSQMGLWFASSAIGRPTSKIVKGVVIILCLVGCGASILLGPLFFALAVGIHAIAISKVVKARAIEQSNPTDGVPPLI